MEVVEVVLTANWKSSDMDTEFLASNQKRTQAVMLESNQTVVPNLLTTLGAEKPAAFELQFITDMAATN